jgi:hypothetical protein
MNYITSSVISREAVRLRNILEILHPKHGVEGSSEAPVHIHRNAECVHCH